MFKESFTRKKRELKERQLMEEPDVQPDQQMQSQDIDGTGAKKPSNIYYFDSITEIEVVLRDGQDRKIVIPLHEVDSVTLRKKRNSHNPGIAVKIEGHSGVLYADLPDNGGRIAYPRSDEQRVFPHICPKCIRQRACPYEFGGCSKVCDGRLMPYYDGESTRQRFGNPIERYPYITEGFELFNLRRGIPYYVVKKCERAAF